MTQDELIAQITAALREEPVVRALFLSGSFGSGTADRYSDVDFLAIVEPAQHAAFAASWRTILERITPIVFWSQRAWGQILVNAIDRDWLRCDLVIAGPDGLKARAQD